MAMNFADLRIRNKLLIVYPLIFLIAVAVGSVVVYMLIRDSIELAVESELKNTTTSIINMIKSSAKHSVRNYLRSASENNLEVVAYYHDLQSRKLMSEEKAKAMAEEFLLRRKLGKTGYVFAINSNKQVIFHPFLPKALNVNELNIAQNLIELKEGYLEYNWANPSERSFRPKSLFVTYFKPWDWLIGVSLYRDELLSFINIDDVHEFIKKQKFGESGYSYVIDSAGNVISHPTQKGNFFKINSPDKHDFMKQIIAKREGKIQYKWKNPEEGHLREKVAVFGYIPELDWVVGSAGYVEEFGRPLERIKLIIAITAVCALAFMFFITHLLSQGLTRRLFSLISAFERGAGGDLSVRVAPGSKDELGILAGYFNEFMRRFEDYGMNLRAEIEERMRAETALRKSEENYRSIFENAVEGIFRSTPDGRFLTVNPAMAAIFGYSSPPEMIQSISDIAAELYYNPEDRRKFLTMVMDDGCYGGYEARYKRKDGSMLWGTTHSRLVRDAQGKVLYFEGSFIDITERKELEKAERERKTAEASSEAKSRFLAGLSHEMRTPMNAVMGMADLLWDSDLKPEQRMYVRLFRTAGNNLLQIINDLLDISRAETGGLILNNRPFELDSLLVELCKISASQARKKGLETICLIRPETSMTVMGDAGLLRKMISAIIDNAVKFTDKGHIQLSLDMEKGNSGECTWVIDVLDTGIGIPPDKLESMYEIFQRGDTSLTRSRGGVGLGLALCRKIADLMGGSISVSSEPGRGSTFTVRLPLEPVETSNEQARRKPRKVLEDKRIMLAGSGASVDALAFYLGALGARVHKTPEIDFAEITPANEELIYSGYEFIALNWRKNHVEDILNRPENDSFLESHILIFAAWVDELKDAQRTAHACKKAGILLKPFSVTDVMDAFTAWQSAKAADVKTRPETPPAESAATGAIETEGFAQTDSAESSLPVSPTDKSESLVRVLLVEDSPDNRFLVQAYLKKTCYRLDMAENGRIGLEMFKTGEYDIVLMDIEMPVMDGLTATRKIREWEKERNLGTTPVIAVTANAFQADREKCLNAGCSEYLSKPVKKSALLKAMEKSRRPEY